MKKLDRVKQGQFDHLLKTQPLSLVGERIDEPTMIYEDGLPMLGYFFVPQTLLKDIRRVVRETRPQKSSRTNGLPTQSTVYGVMPRNHLRTDYCRFTHATRSEKCLFNVMNHYCIVLCEFYQRYFPDNYQSALAEIRTDVHSDWRHNATPFQTININVNHAIKYHRDTGNFRQAMSTVLIVKDGISGGELVVPEYNLTLSQRDGAFTIFNGLSLIHGVLPIQRTRKDGYRASIVFYSMNALKNCYPFQDEINRIAERERNKSVIRYSLENKKALVRMNRRALEQINSPWLKLIEGEKPDATASTLSDPSKEGSDPGSIRDPSGNLGREIDPGGLEEK